MKWIAGSKIESMRAQEVRIMGNYQKKRPTVGWGESAKAYVLVDKTDHSIGGRGGKEKIVNISPACTCKPPLFNDGCVACVSFDRTIRAAQFAAGVRP